MKFSTRTVHLFSFILISTFASAQCGSDEYNEELRMNDSEAHELYQRFLKDDLPSVLEYRGTGVNKKAVRVIPVVFHVIHTYGEENISKEQIEDQIRVINEDFQRLNADTSKTRSQFKGVAVSMDIEFRLARRDPLGRCTEGITRTHSTLTVGGDEFAKNLIRWDYKKYLNIWVIKEIGRSGWNGGTVLGYAVFPNSTSAQTDGIVIRADRVGSNGISVGNGRTLTHEIGHWLGLYHTFQGGCSTNKNLTDQVDDTPPVDAPSYGCPNTNNTCHNDNPDALDMIENYMDYSNDNCMNMFSAGQKNRVDFFLSSSTYRGSNISASTLNATGVNTDPDCGPIADFYTDDQNTIICQATGTVTFKDYSYNGEILEREWIFEGGTPSISTFANPTVQYANSGLFTVTLIVKNNEGSDTLVRTQFISVLPAVAERKAPYGQDFEDVNATIGWELQNASPYGWMVDNSRGYLSSHSARAYITSNTDDGDKFSMIMPPVDVSVHGTPLNLTFKHAYSRRSTTLTEVMLIAISEDCGKTWTTVKGFTASNGLASITGANPGWFPTSASDWGYQVVNLDKYANSKNLMIRFDVISKSGNSVYIDDINLAQFGLSAESLSLANKVQLYPNPASDQITVELQFDGKATIYLRDLSGRVLKVEELNGSLNLINTGSLAAGMYIAEIRIGDYVWSQKLIIN